MPATISIAIFVFGAILLLIALVGQPFQLFGANIPGVPQSRLRLLAGIAGAALITLALSQREHRKDQSSTTADTSTIASTSTITASDNSTPVANGSATATDTLVNPAASSSGDDGPHIDANSLFVGVWKARITMWPVGAPRYAADITLALDSSFEGVFLMSVDDDPKCGLLIRAIPEENTLAVLAQGPQISPDIHLCSMVGIAKYRLMSSDSGYVLVRTTPISGNAEYSQSAMSLELARRRWTCADANNRRKPPRESMRTVVTIDNRSSANVEVFKILENGSRTYELSVQSGSRRRFLSQSEQPWLITAKNGECLRYVVAPDEIIIEP